MRIKIKLDNRIIVVAIFFILFMILQQLGSGMLLVAYFVIGEFLFYLYLRLNKRTSRNTRRLFLLMLFFWFQEFTSAQENSSLRYTVYVIELLTISYLFVYSIRHIRGVNSKHFKITTIVLCAFLVFNFVGIMITYGNPVIFALSAYDSCKYFILIFYVLAIKASREDIKDLLSLIAGMVIMHTACAVMQFMGNELFFDIFRGRFKIVTRVGNFRSIGMFPYGIELGNYCCVLFALYYSFSRLLEKEKRLFYNIIEICLILCIIMSGTRTAMANVFFLYIIANIGNVKRWMKGVLVIVCVLIIGSNFISYEEIISRTLWDVSIELPRNYYLDKGIDIWKDHPLFGIGYNTYGSSKYRERTNDIIFNTYDAHKFEYANLATTDSFAVELLPEFGILGISTIILYGYYIYKNYKKTVDNNYYKAFIMIIISITIMSINTSTSYINPHIGSWFWISCGLLLSREPDVSTGDIRERRE